ncbi:MAG: hypothetical protein AB8F34_15280 [Akkermansiaceae bacterium]
MRVGIICLLMLVCSGFSGLLAAEKNHVILCGGPALRKWENLRVERDQHDRWWANFIRASTLRMVEIRRAYGKDAAITWIVYRPGYTMRSGEDGKPYTTWINELAAKRRVTLRWVSTGPQAIAALNNHPSRSVVTFDFFGHSNKHCFLLDYSSKIMGASKAWIHEKDLSRIRRGIFARNAYCKSWGCHTGESMSAYWKRAIGNTMIGAKGKTDYRTLSHGKMPSVSGSWVR